MNANVAGGTSSIDQPHVSAVLHRLHKESRAQTWDAARFFFGFELGRKRSVAEETARAKSLYLALPPSSCRFAYQMARSIGARRIVEFGTSFGVSTVYLAAAVRDNGGGTVIGSELQPDKVARAHANLEEARLGDMVEIREGDARETLQDPGGPVDMVLLDGKKELYLPILQLLTPHLHPSSVVLADNIYLFRRALRPYVTFVRNPANGFQSTTLRLGTGLEYSVRL